MRNFILLLIFIISLVSKSQTFDFDNYQPLRSSGSLPVEFTSTSTEKYQSKKTEIANAQSKFEKSAKDQFYLESTFGLDGTLKSGKVLFNDTIGNYVTAIMQKILEDEEMKKNVRVYCIKSSEVNAYATGEGVIFVTMGLLASVKTESQLAFILCHEYMHYVYKHSVKGYIQTKKILKGKENFGDLSLEKKFLASRAFSREQESEADLKGLEIYLKSDYSLTEIDSAFQMLKFSYLPFGLRTLDRSFIESGHFKIPDNFFLSRLSEINADDYEDVLAGKTVKKKRRKAKKDTTDLDDAGVRDLESTHPSIEKRLKDIHKNYEADNKPRSNFIISRESFYFIQKIARYELVRLNLLNHSYERAFYNAYNLLKEDPESRYLKKSAAKALYGIAKFANTGNLSMIHIKKKYTQGQWQQVPHLVSKLKGEGVSAWAITYLWKLVKQYPDDEEIKLIFEDMMHSMVAEYVIKKNDFIMRYEDTLNVGSRNRRLKPYIRLAFVDLFVNEPEFKKEYDYAFIWHSNRKNNKPKDDSKAGRRRAEIEAKRNSAETRERKRYDDDKIEEANREDIAIHWNEKLVKEDKHFLDTGRLMILCPRYSYWVVQGLNGSYKYLESEKGKIEMQNSLNDFLPKIFPGAELIANPTSEEVERLNQIGLLYDWAVEKIENGKLNMVSVDYERIQAMVKENDAGNLMLLSALSVKDKKDAGTIIIDLLIGVGAFPAMPLVLYSIFTPSYSTNIYTITLNFKQDKIIAASRKFVGAKSNRSFFNSQLYAMLLKLKKS